MTRDGRINALRMQLEDAQAEAAHLAGLVDSLKAERERLRERAIRFAAGELCLRCGSEIEEAGTAAPLGPAPEYIVSS
ncbi:MAG TPA: hypothetical protein VEO73_08965 [Gemmatimonadales bacterium]|nr:hypothetical protein [Gemmatimonadales bacterium]